MNTDRLRFDLADLAEEATPVDLRDRALRTSRRLGIQRAVATSAAAVVLLGAATGTAFALTPRGNVGPAPAPAASATATPTATATDEPRPTPSATASTAPGGTETGPTATIGRVFYGPAPGGTGAASLVSWTPGSQPRRLRATVGAVSPDGRQVAWVDETFNLYVAAVDGSGKRKLRGQTDNVCWTPAWSPDSRTLSVGTVAASGEPTGRGILNLGSGALTPLAVDTICHPVWSADGSRIAAAGGSGQIFLMNPDGTGRRAIPNLGGSSKWVSFDLASLSPDGSRIALLRRLATDNAGDVANELTVNAILDTRSGAEIKLPLGGRQLIQAYFQADGTLVARVKGSGGNVLVLIGADGRKISESPEPAELASMQILAVTD